MCRWMAGAAGSLCHAMLPRSGRAPWRRCSDGEGAAGQSLQGLRAQRLKPSLVVRSPSLSEYKLQAKWTGAGLDGRLSSLDPQPVGIMRPLFWSIPHLYTWQCTNEEKGPHRAGAWLKVTLHINGMILTILHHPNSWPINLTQERKESCFTSRRKPLSCLNIPGLICRPEYLSQKHF